MRLDLSDLESVRAFARAFKERHGNQLDVLVNNGESRLMMVAKVLVWNRTHDPKPISCRRRLRVKVLVC